MRCCKICHESILIGPMSVSIDMTQYNEMSTRQNAVLLYARRGLSHRLTGNQSAHVMRVGPVYQAQCGNTCQTRYDPINDLIIPDCLSCGGLLIK